MERTLRGACRRPRRLSTPPNPLLKRTELEYLSETVGKHFRVRHIEGDRFRFAFFTRETVSGTFLQTDSEEVDRAFESLRVELKETSHVPTLQLFDSDGVVTVARIGDPAFRSSRVNWAFFIATLISVQVAGSLLWSSYVSPHGPTGQEAQLDWLSLEAQLGGAAFFGLPLMLILGLHELGHFFTARHYKVRASLPFFIPSTPPLGTFGAFISMRDPLPARRAIFDIGLSGPLVGFVASIAVTAVGAVLMQGQPAPTRPELGNSVNLGTPLMFDWVLNGIGSAEDSYLHPTLFAGWAGFLVTAFNLIPAAQLDGGHVMYSLLGNGPSRASRAVMISAAAVLGIAVLGSLLGYTGWLLLIIIVFLTIRHPPPLNQISSLGSKRMGAGALAILVFAVSFSPAPISLLNADYAFDVEPSALAVVVPAGGAANVSFNVTNTGNSFNPLRVEVKGSAGPFTASFNGTNISAPILTNRLEFLTRTVNITVESLARTEGESGAVFLIVQSVGNGEIQEAIVIYAVTGPSHPGLSFTGPSNVSAPPGTVAAVPLEARNAGDVPLNLSFERNITGGSWASGFNGLVDTNASARLMPGETLTVNYLVLVSEEANASDTASFTVTARDPAWPTVAGQVDVTVRVGS